MPTAVDTQELSRINQQNFNDLVASINEYGYNLRSGDIDELRVFFDRGAEQLKTREPIENYEDLLSFATGQLANKFAFSTPAEMARFSSFRDFLRSFCPLDPFC